jgi:4-alpha-glucanotransferase
MKFTRSSGVLLHPTSFPGPYGIGEIGQAARDFIEWLARAGQTLWQVLPLGPTGYGDSPYQSFSTFAGNPLLISLDALHADGYLSASDLENVPSFPHARVDYGPVIEWKMPLLRRAAENFKHAQRPGHVEEFHRFCDENAAWLDDYALYAALKDHFGGAAWNTWDPPIAHRQPEALAEWNRRLGDDVLTVKFLQWQFFRQWFALKERANELGIKVIGDIPIFVAYDSADVWAHPDLFYLDARGYPTVVAGVPPDYFSETGQLWGNPLYRWDVLAARGYDWWIERIRATLKLVDIVRIDHFRGFVAYWEVPATEATAVHGRWVQGPASALFDAVRDALGDAPIIAEDLGVMTPEVTALRDRYDFPGMKILQFAFSSDAHDPFLPHNYPRNCVVYTGTHDNDTAMGWFATAPEEERKYALTYLGADGSDFAWDLIRIGQLSVGDIFVAPLQDLLNLGTEARMNFPSRAQGNWGWRMSADAMSDALMERLQTLTVAYGRFEEPQEEEDKVKAVEQKTGVQD